MTTKREPKTADVDLALEQVLDWCLINQERFYTSSRRKVKVKENAVGLWSPDAPGDEEHFPGRICVSRAFLPLLLKEFGFAPKTIIEKWSLNGWLMHSCKGYVIDVFCNGAFWPCYVFSLAAFERHAELCETEQDPTP